MQFLSSYDGPMSLAPDRGELAQALHGAGHRVTAPRLAVWAVLSQSPGHLTAEEIADRVRDQDPGVNLSSVYRSLSLLSDLGLVRESSMGGDRPSHWELAHPDEQFHLRCYRCGRVDHHAGDLVSGIREHLASDHGFAAERIELLVSGLCPSCRNLRV